jgi:hypothetical protein
VSGWTNKDERWKMKKQEVIKIWASRESNTDLSSHNRQY